MSVIENIAAGLGRLEAQQEWIIEAAGPEIRYSFEAERIKNSADHPYFVSAASPNVELNEEFTHCVANSLSRSQVFCSLLNYDRNLHWAMQLMVYGTNGQYAIKSGSVHERFLKSRIVPCLAAMVNRPFVP